MPLSAIPRKPFVFMSVDVIDHTERLRNALGQSNYDFRELDDVLNRLPEAIDRALATYPEIARWDWAGDGGIYALPAEFETTAFARVIEAAESIIAELAAFNGTHDLDPIRLRIAIDHGVALVKEDKAFCRSLALNVAAKLKVPDDRDSISITEQIHQEIRKVGSLAAKFVPLPWATDETPRHQEVATVYGHADLIRRALIAKRDQHVAAGRSFFAAHCEYRRFCVELVFPLRLAEAQEAISSARSLADEETSRSGYFVNVMRSFYGTWERVIRECVGNVRLQGAGDRLVFILQDEQPLVAALGVERYRLLRDVEFIIEQLDLLATLVLNGPSSIITLEMNALLLRAGYSPLYVGRAVERKTESDFRELRNSQWRLHGDCSLCTAVVVGALGLAGIKPTTFRHAVQWLETLAPSRFAHHSENYAGAKATEHGMHYAAHVLQAFLESSAGERPVQSVVEVLFPPQFRNAQEVLDYWMKWRSEGIFDVGRQIFTALLELDRSPYRELLDPHRILLREICELYVGMVRADAALAGVDPEPVLHAFRDNATSFTLGHLLGSASCTQPLEAVLTTFGQMAARAVEIHRSEAWQIQVRRRYLLASKVDRAFSVIEGWLAALDARC